MRYWTVIRPSLVLFLIPGLAVAFGWSRGGKTYGVLRRDSTSVGVRGR
jgi:hypothetical protein